VSITAGPYDAAAAPISYPFSANTTMGKLHDWPTAKGSSSILFLCTAHEAQNTEARITKGVITLIVLIVVGFRLTSRWPYDAGGSPDHR
jgi:hypothetical protein